MQPSCADPTSRASGQAPSPDYSPSLPPLRTNFSDTEENISAETSLLWRMCMLRLLRDGRFGPWALATRLGSGKRSSLGCMHGNTTTWKARRSFAKWCGRVASLPTVQPEEISGSQVAERILGSKYLEEREHISPNDVLGISAGTRVSIEGTDSTPGSHLQYGKLVGAGRDETVLELENGIRLHFPRNGYVVKAA